MILFGIKNCDTVSKAKRWLDQHQLTYQFHDLRLDGLSIATIESWLESVEWQTLLNKRSSSWRKLSDKQRENMNKEKAMKLMFEHPTLIKRPVLVSSKVILVGFDEARYQELSK